MAIGQVEFGYGSVQYVREVEATPTTTEVQGSVTINKIGSPGRDAYFLVTFMLTCEPDNDAEGDRNIFHWTEKVAGLARGTPYSEIEAHAARQLSPNLRSAADHIERMVADFDKTTNK